MVQGTEEIFKNSTDRIMGIERNFNKFHKQSKFVLRLVYFEGKMLKM